jgi:hypothetical protein
VGQTTGVGLVEIYDNNQRFDPICQHQHARGFVQTGTKS